jgi:putative IMPACT (imprinted ancient) family translation regulator
LRNAAIVVSRHFGGTKLGVGGLARAYGEAARAVIEQASKRLAVEGSLGRIRYGFAFTPQVMRALELFGAESILHGFDAPTDQAQASFALEDSKVEEIEAYLRDTSSGLLHFEVLEAVVLYRPWSG